MIPNIKAQVEIQRAMQRIDPIHAYGKALGLSVQDMADVLNQYGRECTEQGVIWDDAEAKRRMVRR